MVVTTRRSKRPPCCYATIESPVEKGSRCGAVDPYQTGNGVWTDGLSGLSALELTYELASLSDSTFRSVPLEYPFPVWSICRQSHPKTSNERLICSVWRNGRLHAALELSLFPENSNVQAIPQPLSHVGRNRQESIADAEPRYSLEHPLGV